MYFVPVGALEDMCSGANNQSEVVPMDSSDGAHLDKIKKDKNIVSAWGGGIGVDLGDDGRRGYKSRSRNFRWRSEVSSEG